MIKFGIGQAVRRVEDQRFLTGQGRYVDDITLPGMCHGVNVLSPHAHARIKKVDASKARAVPGVLLVLTGTDIAHDHLGAFTAGMMPEDLGAPKGHRIHQQLLQSDKARFVGDRIAVVVAETLAQARDAAEMVEVDYEALPAVALLEDAAKDGSPKVWDDNPNGNVAFQLMIGDQAATDTAFAGQQRITTLYLLIRDKIPPYYTLSDITNDTRGLYVHVETRELEYYSRGKMEKDPCWQNLTHIFQRKVRVRDIYSALAVVDPVFPVSVYDFFPFFH